MSDDELLEVAQVYAALPLALQEVQKAVSELHQADFNTADELLEAKARLNSALLKARSAGASEVDILKSSKPTVSLEVDTATVGAAARRARKLRQLEKELKERNKLQEQQRLERERADKIAKAAAARREIRAVEKAEKAKRREARRKERERSEERKRSRTRSRGRRRSSSRSSSPRKALQQPVVHSAVAAGTEISGELVVHPSGPDGDAAPSRLGPGRINDGRAASPLRFRGSPSRRADDASAGALSLAPEAYDFVTPRVPLPEEIVKPAEPDADQCLAALLGRQKEKTAQPGSGPPGAGSAKQKPLDMSQLPLSVLTGGAAVGQRRYGNFDMSTGGDEICHNYSMGKCTRWGCKFKHVDNRR